jgi:hypothetical protein
MRNVDNQGTDELGRDMELASALQFVDPATDDANYWLRFRAWVMKSAATELARRRLVAELTMGDVVTSWARAVVPTALAAAVVAGLVLLRGAEVVGPPVPVGVEELLVVDLEEEAIPSALAADEATAFVAFAAERF